VVLAALVSVSLPGRFFTGQPSGTVSAQVGHVTLKLAAAYLLAVGSWLLLLGWLAVLFGRQQPPAVEAPVPVAAGPEEETQSAEIPPPDEGGLA
jgi:hypothetical protein